MTTKPYFTAYITTNCGDCARLKQWLNDHDYQHGEDYKVINLDEDPSAIPMVEEINNGSRSVPTLVFSDNTTLTEPSNDQLAAKMAEYSENN